ncbi:AAA family ATPase [Lentzea sp.]|uniref:AAA family ATPase n=1 Tax=Lentzea sp. TaxID=56099 RepID=UPI002CA49FCE|nr:AAA family ATPase [Lentzea sp.]HUQ59175.1 AAA family ATPase [Lentzea sp.]
MTEAGYCVFVNGLPGSGKSTYARKFVDARRGWLNLDVDVLRGLLGTASVDFLQAGVEVQPLALAVLREQIASGGNVIFPQLFFTPEEAAEFEAAVMTSGGRVRRTMLHEDVRECWRRVEERARRAPEDSIYHNILNLLTKSGGILELQRMEHQLSAWSKLPDPPHIISSSTPYDEFAALAIA